jgi:GTPase SAR1 family protein
MIQEVLTVLRNLLQGLPPSVLWAVLWAVGLVVASVFCAFLLSWKVPRAYSVAVIGFSRAGKTTLIQALFEQVRDGKIEVKGVRPTLSAKGTKARIERQSAWLERQQALGPTRDQDMYAYRTDIELGALFRKPYKVEFGDFPGVMSEELADGAIEPLLDRDYAKWVCEADAFIFAIDLARLFEDYERTAEINRAYLARVTTGIRTSWQYITENHISGNGVKSLPVVLAFTKSDLINYVSDDPSVNVTELIQKWGFDEMPEIKEVDCQKLAQYAPRVKEAFSKPRSVLKEKGNKFTEVFVSSFGNMDGYRLGFDDLLLAIMP